MKCQITEKVFPALGTLNAVTCRTPSEQSENALETLQNVRDMVLRLDDLLSLYKDSSELSAINRLAGNSPCQVSTETYEIFEASMHYSELTKGAFDITAGSLSLLWRRRLKQRRVPGFFERNDAQRHTDFRNIVLSKDENPTSYHIFLKKPGMTADLGGIAKGYAVDRARGLLLKAGIEEATINFGGTVYTIGTQRDVGIQNPFSSRSSGTKVIGTLRIRDEAVVTSGSNERFHVIDGNKYHHIIDPRTGEPATSGLVSVTLVGTNAMELDALATGCFVLGVERSMPILRERGIGAIFIAESGTVWITEDLKTRFRPASTCIAG